MSDRYRSAASGEFVTEAEAEANPATTVHEVDKTTPLGEVERLLEQRARTIAELERDAAELEERAVELFNPPDDDCVSVYSILESAAAYIAEQTCDCTPAMVEDLEPCPRCRELGRLADTPVSR